MATRPAELIYAVDERPPWSRLIPLGLQHAVLASVYLILIVIIMRAAGATEDVTLASLSLGMIALAIASILQALPHGRVGSGYLAVPVFSAIYLGPSVLAAKAGGLPAVFGMTIFAGVVEIVLSRFLHRLRALFPPAVSGFIVCIVGIQLGLVGMEHALAVNDYHRPSFLSEVGVAALTLATCLGLSVWAGGFIRLICSLLGLVTGFAVAALLGLVPGPALDVLKNAPWVALPNPAYVSYSFAPGLAPAFLAAGIAATLRTIGVITTCQKINDADWKRPDLRTIKGGTLADGIGCVIGGLLGVSGLNAGPSLVGVSNATRATSRWIAYACGGILIVFALMPKIVAIFLVLPLSAAAGMLVFTASFMVAGGIQIMTSRNLDTRMTYVIGLSFLLALSREVFPAYFGELPSFLAVIASGTLPLGVATAVGLTLLFRIGIRRTRILPLPEAEGSIDRLADFIRKQGKAWKIDADVVERCVSSTTEAVGHMESADLITKMVAVEVAYDDLDLMVALKYEGRLLSLPDFSVRRRKMLEEESFAYGLANFLTGVYPDRVESFTNRDQAVLRLFFAA